ncbi:hypothetical protein AGMMS50293_17050 [Spirochaetia bacterium]|nr:hypothetical protein AGMMS50293_17050 [Spirochaetia bacterium]
MLLPHSLWAQNVSDIVGDTFEETAGRGLAIRTRPAGVTVFVDGVERGQTPLSIDTLRAGEYNIRLRKDGYRDRRFKITLAEKSRLTVSIEMEEALGQALVNIFRAEGSPGEDTLPLNPAIFSGSDEMYGPVLNLPVGRRTIRVRAFGWEDASATVFIEENRTAVVNITLKPMVFKLSGGNVSRRRFNPDNSGSLGLVQFRFEVSGPGSGVLTILDKNGAAVYQTPLGPFTAWSQSAAWNGRDSYGNSLPEGTYTALIEASGAASPQGETNLQESGPAKQSLKLQTEINYSINIYPLSLASGFSGLAFAPVPSVLPQGSFQIEADILFGSFSAPEQTAQPARPFSALPFEMGLRFTPINRLEIAAVLNANPKFDGAAGWGFTGSAKFKILNSAGALPLGMAAGISYAWAGTDGEAPLGSGRGGGLYLPLSLELPSLSLVFSPGMRWPGPDDPIPRLLLSTGALYRGPWYTAGLSLRPEFDFTNSGNRTNIPFADRVRFLTGAEARFYPPPSNLIFSVLGGAWIRGSHAGGFGGLGIGLLY